MTNQLTQFWRLKNLRICHLQAGDTEKPGVWFQSKSEGLKTGGADSFKSQSGTGEDEDWGHILSRKAERQILPSSDFYFI